MSDYMGWSNKETWNVQLHASNDYDTYLYYKEALEHFIDRDYDRRELIASMAYLIETDHKDKIERQNVSGVLLDLITYSLLKVDWNQIAENMVDEAVKPIARIKLKGFRA